MSNGSMDCRDLGYDVRPSIMHIYKLFYKILRDNKLSLIVGEVFVLIAKDVVYEITYNKMKKRIKR